MSSQAIIKSILQQQNEELLTKIAAKFDLDKDELFSKYLRPTFYLPVKMDTGKTVVYKETMRSKKQSQDAK